MRGLIRTNQEAGSRSYALKLNRRLSVHLYDSSVEKGRKARLINRRVIFPSMREDEVLQNIRSISPTRATQR